MRILFLNPSGQLGGAEAVLLDLLAAIRQAEPAWDLWLILGEPGPAAERASALGVAVSVLPFPKQLARLGDAGAGGPAGRHAGLAALTANLVASSPSVWRYSRVLRQAVSAIRPDAVHTNGFKMHILGHWARTGREALIWHVHDYVGKRAMMAKLMRLSASGCTVAAANSQSVAADLRSVCPGLKVVPVLNGIDLSKFAADGPALNLDALSGLAAAEPGTVRAGLVATLAKWKGHETFLDAMAMLPADSKVRAYVVGGALYQTAGSQWSLAELKRMAERRKLGGRIGFPGFQTDPAAAMRALDIVVHASTQPEPFGLAIAEAMACGRAVISSESGGAAEIVRRGVNAEVHRPGDAESLAAAVEKLARDPGLRLRLGQAGRETAEKQFGRRRMADEMIAVYREAVKKPCGSSTSTAGISTAA